MWLNYSYLLFTITILITSIYPKSLGFMFSHFIFVAMQGFLVRLLSLIPFWCFSVVLLSSSELQQQLAKKKKRHSKHKAHAYSWKMCNNVESLIFNKVEKVLNWMLNVWFRRHLLWKNVIDFAYLKDSWLCCPDFVTRNDPTVKRYWGKFHLVMVVVVVVNSTKHLFKI